MLNSLLYVFKDAIGLNHFSSSAILPMLIRGFIILLLGILLARSNKKLMGIRTPFNFILFVMLGSLGATAISESKYFIPILTTITFLTIFNGFATILTFYFPEVERFINGNPDYLVKDSKIQWDEMKKNFVTERELLNELHTQLHTRDLNKIKSAMLISDGSINFTVKE